MYSPSYHFDLIKEMVRHYDREVVAKGGASLFHVAGGHEHLRGWRYMRPHDVVGVPESLTPAALAKQQSAGRIS